jgi:AAA ATPase domain
MSSSERGPGLRGRRSECNALDRLLIDVRAGRSPVLVLRGEAGVGKTALVHYLVERASGCRVTRAAGVESEMELAFAGLQQLCAPFLDRLERLHRSAARRARHRVRPEYGRAARSLSGGPGRPEPVVRRRCGSTADLCSGRRPVARPNLRSGSRVRGASSGRRLGRHGLRRPRFGRRAGPHRATRTRRARAG